MRLYGKHMEIPLDVLLNPGAYLRGSYSALHDLIKGVCTTAHDPQARRSFCRGNGALDGRQVGPALSVLRGRSEIHGPTSARPASSVTVTPDAFAVLPG